MERNKRNRQLPVSDEEAQRRREMARAKLAAEKPTTCVPPQKKFTRATQHQEEAVLQAQRLKWKLEKQEQRKKWSAQKRRQHRLKALSHYYRKKAETSPRDEADCMDRQGAPSAEQAPHHGKAGQQKAVYRAKNALFKVHPSLWTKMYRDITSSALKSPQKRKAVECVHGVRSASAEKVRHNVKARIKELSKGRSKKNLAARELLLDAVNGFNSTAEPVAQLYVKKKSAASEAVRQFLEEISIDLPGKRSVSKRTMQQKKILPKRVKRLHSDFRKKFPQHKVSRATFYRCIPDHIVAARKQSYVQCLCEICRGIDLKLDAVNKHMAERIDGRDMLCEVSLCPTPTLDCHRRSCPDCDTDVVRSLIEAKLTVGKERVVKWKAWETVQRGNHRRLDLVEKDGTLDNLICILLDELHKFSYHVFVARWQHMQFRGCLSALHERPSMAVALFDFSENYLCRYQDEVQAAHWGYSQVTLHPVVIYYKCRHCPEVVTDYRIFLSDDLRHDSGMVRTILDKTIIHLSEQLYLEKLIIFSDGCASQYKSKLPWFHLAKRSEPVAIEWAYFGSRHGKSPCDACGGVTKRLVDEDVLAREAVIQDASSMYAHLAQNYTQPLEGEEIQDACCHKKRGFFQVNSEEVDRSVVSSDLHTLKGTQQLHSVRGLGRNTLQLQTRKLSCFCSACLDGQPGCEHSTFVDDWKDDQVRLKLSQPSVASESPPQSAPSSAPPSSASASPPPSPASASPPPSPASAPPLPSPASAPPLPSPASAPPLPSPASAPPLPSPASAPPLPSQPPPKPSTPRLLFFRRLHRDLRSSKMFQELQAVVADNLAEVETYRLPPILLRTVVGLSGCVDRKGLTLRPDTVPSHLFPLITGSDGNCFPICLSVFVYGKELYHQEMRCRLVLELVNNFERYVQGEGMAQEGETPEQVVGLLAVVAENSGVTLETVNPEDVCAALSAEIMQIRQMSAYCGLWQIAATANVLGVPICSVYPHKGWQAYVSLNNRTLSPFHPSVSVTCHIMWSSNREGLQEENWTANHFVPLLPLLDPDAPVQEMDGGFEAYSVFEAVQVSVDDYFHVTWEGKDYVGKVDNKCEECVQLSFMKLCANYGLYMWPILPDTSFEHVRILKERVELELVEECSTQRKQYYRMVLM